MGPGRRGGRGGRGTRGAWMLLSGPPPGRRAWPRRLGLSASRLSGGTGAVGSGARAARGLGALAPARANERRGRAGRSSRGPWRPGCPRVRCAAAWARRGGGGRTRASLGGGIALSSQTAGLTEGPGLSRRGRGRRSRPAPWGAAGPGSSGSSDRSGQPGAAAPALGAAADWGRRGLSAPPDGPERGRKAGARTWNPRRCPVQAPRWTTRLRPPFPCREPSRAPALTAASARAARRPGSSVSPALRPPWRARSDSLPLWRWRGAARDFYPAGPPGSKRRRTQGSKPRGLREERTGVARGPAPSATCGRDPAPQSAPRRNGRIQCLSE